ncbi:MAG TPA: condensation domain-containing protein [Gaiellaceae bacterium]
MGEAFSAISEVAGDAVALVGADFKIGYDELERRSNQVAAGVLGESDGGGPVALLVGDGISFAVSLLGVLKAGRIALPLDRGLPEARLVSTLLAANAGLAIGDRQTGLELPVLMRSERAYARESDRRVEHRIDPGSGALLTFTSGSTGEPRGHLRSHRMILHDALEEMDSGQNRVGMRFGLAVSPLFLRGSLFRCVLTGATLLRYDSSTSGLAGLGAWLNENEVEETTLVPSMIDALTDSCGPGGLRSVRMVGLSGEPVDRRRAEALRRLLPPGGTLRHGYGQTETSRISYDLIDGPITLDDSPLPVGFAHPDIGIILRDSDGSAAESGEIVVESDYLTRPWSTDAIHSVEPAPRIRHTGDFGTIDSEGRLVVLGRVDRMVKIRGYRVELGAIERTLLGVAGVTEAAVIHEPTPRGTRRLAAFIVCDPPLPNPAAALRPQLASVLPGYMIPNRFVPLDRLPRNANGKVDLKALDALPSAEPTAPGRGSTEERVAAIWADVLEVDRVGRGDDFLELGGDSLSAAVIASAVHTAFGVELTPTLIDENPTVAEMSAAIEQLQAIPASSRRPPLVPARRDGPLPVGIVQEVFLRGETPGNDSAFKLPSAVEIRGDLDPGALMQAIQEITRRHDLLRTTFSRRGKDWVQVVHPAPFIDLELVDLRDRREPTAAAAQLLSEQIERPFDLEHEPPLRFRLVRTGEHEHQLLRIQHHTVCDPWSSTVFFTELAALYPSYRAGRPSPLPELELQYGDYAAWERSHLHRRSRYFWSEIAWWRRTLTPKPKPPQLPFARAVFDPNAHPADAKLYRQLPRELSNALDRLEAECSASYFVVRLAVFAAYLLERTGRRDLALGTAVTPRRVPELQQLIGVFAGLTVLRLRVEGAPSLRDWIGYVRRSLAETSEHSALMYGAMTWAFRGTKIGVPSLDAVFAALRSTPPWESSPIPGLQLREIRLARPPGRMPRKFGLSFTADTTGTRHEEYTAEFDAGKHDPALVSRFLDDFELRAAELCADPDAPLRLDVS